MKKPQTARDLTPHARNLNKGTARGQVQIEESIKRCGYGRSIVVDRENRIIAGNHVTEAAAENNAEVVVVETTGDKLVVVKRTDLDLERDPKAVELAFADNRSSEVGLEWDGDALAREIAEGADFSAYIREDEIEKILKAEAKQEDDGKKKGGSDCVIKLPLDAEQFAEFGVMVKALLDRWQLTSTADVVLEAMRRQVRPMALEQEATE